jgi:insertion element IS1 protein InsB
MIIEVKCCTNCQSENLVKNGKNGVGNPRFKCKACGFSGVIATRRSSEAFKETVIRSAQDRSSSRGLARVFKISHQTALNWIKKKAQNLPDVAQTLLPAESGDILELDELWSFVLKKANKSWIWIALCRRTRQIVSYYVGDRSAKSCQMLWDLIPIDYKKSLIYSDYWEAYSKVIDNGRHFAVGKDSGQTNHVERWNNTLRQRIPRFIRCTLSFSKSNEMHKLYLKLFVHNYNVSFKF